MKHITALRDAHYQHCGKPVFYAQTLNHTREVEICIVTPSVAYSFGKTGAEHKAMDITVPVQMTGYAYQSNQIISLQGLPSVMVIPLTWPLPVRMMKANPLPRSMCTGGLPIPESIWRPLRLTQTPWLTTSATGYRTKVFPNRMAFNLNTLFIQGRSHEHTPLWWFAQPGTRFVCTLPASFCYSTQRLW
jgi:hypothetical protein